MTLSRPSNNSCRSGTKASGEILATAEEVRARKQPGSGARRRSAHRQWMGLAFAAPAIIGLLWFTTYPVLASLYYSFCNYRVLTPPRWIGIGNYRHLWEDPLFYVSLG